MKLLIMKIILKNVRFSYANVFDSKAFEGQEPKYSVSLIIPKSDTKLIAEINAEVKKTLEEGKAKFGGKIPKMWRNPLRDGDVDRADNEEYANCFYLNASSKNQPEIVDSSINPIMDRDEFYSGCYGNASVNLFAYNNVTKGIGVGLNAVMKTRDGENLGVDRGSAEEDFNGLGDDDMM